MKFECIDKLCREHCTCELPSRPRRCLLTGGFSEWKEVTDPAPQPLSEAILPKLTTAVFDREDCPEWAKYAAVNMDRTAFFFGNVPNRGCSNPRKKYWSYHHSEMMKIPGQFDASDWQNSLIERPAKEISKEDVEKFVKNNLNQGYLLVDGELKPIENKLPDWVKVGAWVWVCDETLRQYEQITEVNKTSFVTTHCTRYSVTGLKPARVRPWTFEEAPYHFKTKDNLYFFVWDFDFGWGYRSSKHSTFHSLSEVAELIQADGSPCGVLTINEEK